MSIRYMTMVWDMDLPVTEKFVMMALADCANDAGECWPSIATLVRKTSASERTVQRAIKSFEDNGHLSRREVPGRGVRYFLHPRQSDTPVTVAPPSQRRAPPSQCHPTPVTVTPKPSMNHQEPSLDASHPRGARPAGKPDGEKPSKDKPVIPDWIPAEPWNGYLEMRKRIGKAPTDYAVKLMIGKLERWRADGHDPAAILNEATEHNWTGLYPPKEPRNATRPQGSPDAWRGSPGNRPADNRDGFRLELEERAFGGPAHG